jgi:hypothetical protein
MEMPMADQGKTNDPSPSDIEQNQHQMLTNVNSQSHIDSASWI